MSARRRSTRSESEDDIRRSKMVSGSMPSQLAHLPYTNHGILPIYDSTDSLESRNSLRLSHRSSFIDGSTRFPKLEECAHFHYDLVDLNKLQVVVVRHDYNEADDDCVFRHGPSDHARDLLFTLRVTTNSKSWTIQRRFSNFRLFDHLLHKCIFDRRFSHLPKIQQEWGDHENQEEFLYGFLGKYTKRFSEIAGSMLNCGPILNWLELDNRGNRLLVVKDSGINTPAIAAAHAIRRYTAQAPDEISLEVGDIVSVIDMPPVHDSCWWRGKRGFEVGFFPLECVEIIGDKVPQAVSAKTSPKLHRPLLRKNGKLATLFRGFFSTRPSRNQLKQSGIVKERVFGCDLGEHLLNASQDVPLVLQACCSVIEEHGIVDGIYRLSGISSNINKLRVAFDEDHVPDLTEECYRLDIHSISSLVKMYLRELPNPLLTYQLYDKFADAVQDEDNKLMKIHDVVQQLPPPHYRTTEFLMRHLARVASHSLQTGMHSKNLAIVWAPNLLRSKELEMGGGAAALQGVGIQAVVTEFMICYVDLIFSDKLPTQVTGDSTRNQRKPRPKSLAISTPTRLLSLEEARERALSSKYIHDQKYIEVGGGPETLPTRYHTVLDLPGYKKKNNKENLPKEATSYKAKKSPSETRAVNASTGGWKSFFSKTRNTSVKDKMRKSSIPDTLTLSEQKVITEHDANNWKRRRLRSSKSVESLVSGGGSRTSSRYSRTDEGETTPTPQRKRRSSSGSRSRSQSLDQAVFSHHPSPPRQMLVDEQRVSGQDLSPCSDISDVTDDFSSFQRTGCARKSVGHRKTASAPVTTSGITTPLSERRKDSLSAAEQTPSQRKKPSTSDVSKPVSNITIPKQLQEKFVLHVNSPDILNINAYDDEKLRKGQKLYDGKSPKFSDRKTSRGAENKSPKLEKTQKSMAKSRKKSRAELMGIDTPILRRSPNASRKFSAPDISHSSDLETPIERTDSEYNSEFMSHFIQPSFSSRRHDYEEIAEHGDGYPGVDGQEARKSLPDGFYNDGDDQDLSNPDLGLPKSCSISSGIVSATENSPIRRSAGLKASNMAELSRSIDSFSAGLSEDNILCRGTSLDGGTEITSLSHTLREINEQIDKAFHASSEFTKDAGQRVPRTVDQTDLLEPEGDFYFRQIPEKPHVPEHSTSAVRERGDCYANTEHGSESRVKTDGRSNVSCINGDSGETGCLVDDTWALSTEPGHDIYADVRERLVSPSEPPSSPIVLRSSSIFYDFEATPDVEESAEEINERTSIRHDGNHDVHRRIIDVNYVDNLILTHTKPTTRPPEHPGLSNLSNVIDAYCASFKPNETPTDEKMEQFLLGTDDLSSPVETPGDLCEVSERDVYSRSYSSRLQPVTEVLNENSFTEELVESENVPGLETVTTEITSSPDDTDASLTLEIIRNSDVRISDYVMNLTDFEKQIARLKQNMDLVLKDIGGKKSQDVEPGTGDRNSNLSMHTEFNVVLDDSELLNTAYFEGDCTAEEVLTTSQTEIVWNIDSVICEERAVIKRLSRSGSSNLMDSVTPVQTDTHIDADPRERLTDGIVVHEEWSSESTNKPSDAGGSGDLTVDTGANCGSKRPYELLSQYSPSDVASNVEETGLDLESPTKKLKEAMASQESLVDTGGCCGGDQSGVVTAGVYNRSPVDEDREIAGADSHNYSEKDLSEVTSPSQDVIVTYRPTIVKTKKLSNEFDNDTGRLPKRSASPNEKVLNAAVVSVEDVQSHIDSNAKLVRERLYSDHVQTCFATKVERPPRHDPPESPHIVERVSTDKETKYTVSSTEISEITPSSAKYNISQERTKPVEILDVENSAVQTRFSGKIPTTNIRTEVSERQSPECFDRPHSAVNSYLGQDEGFHRHSQLRMTSSAYGALEQADEYTTQNALPYYRQTPQSSKHDACSTDSMRSIVDKNDPNDFPIILPDFGVQKSSSFPNVKAAMTSSSICEARRSSGKLQSLRELFEPTSDQNQSPTTRASTPPKQRPRPLSACIQSQNEVVDVARFSTEVPESFRYEKPRANDRVKGTESSSPRDSQDQNLPPTPPPQRPAVLRWTSKDSDKHNENKSPHDFVADSQRAAPVPRERTSKPSRSAIPIAPRTRVHSDSSATESLAPSTDPCVDDSYGSLDRERLKRNDHKGSDQKGSDHRGSIKELMAVFESQNTASDVLDAGAESPVLVHATPKVPPTIIPRQSVSCHSETNDFNESTIRQTSLRLGPKPFTTGST